MKRTFATLALLALALSGLNAAVAETRPATQVGDEVGLPSNDLRSNARVIEGVPYTDSVDNTLATTESDESRYCSGYGSVWYSFTATANIDLEANTSGTNFANVLSVYGASHSQPEECNYGDRTRPAKLRFSMAAGDRVLFRVVGYIGLDPSPNFGRVVFNLISAAAIPRPANDDRARATIITELPFIERVDNSDASVETDEPSACGLKHTVWYSFTPAEDTFLTANNEANAAGIAVYTSTDPDQAVACTDTDFWDVRLRFTALAGVTYHLQAGQTSSQGSLMTFSLSETVQPGPTPPVGGDEIDNATVIGSLPFTHTATNTGLSIAPDEPIPCGFIGSTTWYRYTALESGSIDVFTKGSHFDTVAAVYESSDQTSALSCNDDLDGTSAGVRFLAEAGNDYYIQLGGRKGDQGTLQVLVDRSFTPSSDLPWEPVEDALIRPGASIGNCTANFVFRGRGIRAGRVYLGTAAHCVEQSVGASIYLFDDDPLNGSPLFDEPIGQVAFSSFKELNVYGSSCYLILSCTDDDGFNDFALIEIDPRFHRYVHPAMRHFGGPTSMASFEEVSLGDKIVSFGNSRLRPGPEVLDWHEGYVTGKAGAMEIDVTMTPGIFGDSGSPVTLADGRALGVLVTLTGNELGTNGVTALQPALDFASRTGWNVDLATWNVLDRGFLP